MKHKDYAIISVYSYNYPKIDISHFGYEKLYDLGWEFVGATSYNEEEPDGYFGTAFKKGNELVIAHRGTLIEMGHHGNFIQRILASTADLDADLSIYHNDVPKQYENAQIFTTKILSNFDKSVKVTHVGHSLGATLAQLMSIGTKTEAVTFDAPGTFKIAQKIFKTSDIDDNLITSYVSAPNLINTSGKHLAAPIQLHFDSIIDHFLNYFAYAKFTLGQHKMIKIAEQFEVNSDSELKIINVKPWPTGFKSGYEYFVKNTLKDSKVPYVVSGDSKEHVAELYGIDISRVKKIGESFETNSYLGNFSRNLVEFHTHGKYIVAPSASQDNSKSGSISGYWQAFEKFANFEIMTGLEMLQPVIEFFGKEDVDTPRNNINPYDLIRDGKHLNPKNFPICENNNEISAIYQAILKNDVKHFLLALKKGVNPNSGMLSKDGTEHYTPMTLAIIVDVFYVKKLIEFGATVDINQIIEEDGGITEYFPLLKIAAENNKIQTVRELLEAEINPNEHFCNNKKCEIKTTVLNSLINKEFVNYDIIQLLIDHGASIELGEKVPCDSIYPFVECYQTPLYKALSNDNKINITLIEKLLELGACIENGHYIVHSAKHEIDFMSAAKYAKSIDNEEINSLFENYPCNEPVPLNEIWNLLSELNEQI